MIIATHIKSGKAYEGHKEGLFFVSGKIGSGEPHVPRDSGGFHEWRNWTQEDHDFNLPKLTFTGVDKHVPVVRIEPLESEIKFDTKPCYDRDQQLRDEGYSEEFIRKQRRQSFHQIDEAGHWDTSKIEKHWKLKPKMIQCKKQTTYAVIMKDGEFISNGSNAIHIDMGDCPRDTHGFKSGEGYHLCKEVCGQKNHAEVAACVAAQAAGKETVGATLYLMGHTYCCDNCIEVMADHGIFQVIIADTGVNFSPLGMKLAKKYGDMNLGEFLEAVGSKTVDHGKD